MKISLPKLGYDEAIVKGYIPKNMTRKEYRGLSEKQLNLLKNNKQLIKTIEKEGVRQWLKTM